MGNLCEKWKQERYQTKGKDFFVFQLCYICCIFFIFFLHSVILIFVPIPFYHIFLHFMLFIISSISFFFIFLHKKQNMWICNWKCFGTLHALVSFCIQWGKWFSKRGGYECLESIYPCSLYNDYSVNPPCLTADWKGSIEDY